MCTFLRGRVRNINIFFIINQSIKNPIPFQRIQGRRRLPLVLHPVAVPSSCSVAPSPRRRKPRCLPSRRRRSGRLVPCRRRERVTRVGQFGRDFSITQVKICIFLYLQHTNKSFKKKCLQQEFSCGRISFNPSFNYYLNSVEPLSMHTSVGSFANN